MDSGFFFFLPVTANKFIVSKDITSQDSQINVTGCQHIQTNLDSSNIRDAETSTRKCPQDKAETERVHCNRNSRHS